MVTIRDNCRASRVIPPNFRLQQARNRKEKVQEKSSRRKDLGKSLTSVKTNTPLPPKKFWEMLYTSLIPMGDFHVVNHQVMCLQSKEAKNKLWETAERSVLQRETLGLLKRKRRRKVCVLGRGAGEGGGVEQVSLRNSYTRNNLYCSWEDGRRLHKPRAVARRCRCLSHRRKKENEKKKGKTKRTAPKVSQ